LNLQGVVESAEPKILTDLYVPVTVQWPKYLSLPEAPICHMISGGATLIEIKLAPDGGEILEIVVIQLGDTQFSELPLPTMPQYEPGAPLLAVIDQDDKEDGIAAPKIRVHRDGLAMYFLSLTPTRYAGSPAAVFGFTESNLLSRILIPIGEAELAVINSN
jgi:hypothetical protein